jgi:hypothetical protein
MTEDKKEKYGFLLDLAEARYMRTDRDITTYKIDDYDVAETFFQHLLILQQMRFENPSWAKQYATDTLRYQHFTGIKTGATDLHNLASILNNPTRYRDKIPNLGTVRFDHIALKRYLRDVILGKNDVQFVRSFFLKMQKTLAIRGSALKIARRVIADYQTSIDNEKTSVTTRLKNSLWKDAKFRSDLYKPYMRSTSDITNSQN